MEKEAEAFTGSVTVSIGPPMKSLAGMYEAIVVDFVSVRSASVLPKVGMKSEIPSKAVYMCVTALTRCTTIPGIGRAEASSP